MEVMIKVYAYDYGERRHPAPLWLCEFGDVCQVSRFKAWAFISGA